MELECQGKRSWPELLGRKGKYAVVKIETENKFVRAILMPEGAPWTADFSCGRVRVAVNKRGIVVNVPTIG